MTLSLEIFALLDQYKAKGYIIDFHPDKGQFIKWSPEVKKKQGVDYDWEEVFGEDSRQMTFKSTHRFTGETENHKQFEHFYEDTGFIRPFFHHEFSVTNEYEGTLHFLGIIPDHPIPLNKLTEINQYQQLLIRQAQRQQGAINNIHKEISDVLKVLICEKIVSGKKKRTKVPDPQVDKLIAEVRSFYAFLITDLNDAGYAKDAWERVSEASKELAQPIVSYVQSGIEILVERRRPIVEVTARLLGKLNAVESIIEDVLLNEKLKEADVFDFLDKPHKDDVYKKYWRLRENNQMNVKLAFEKLILYLTKNKWDPVKYGLRDEPEHFNKAAGDWKRKRIAKNSSYK